MGDSRKLERMIHILKESNNKDFHMLCGESLRFFKIRKWKRQGNGYISLNSALLDKDSNTITCNRCLELLPLYEIQLSVL